MLARLLLTKSYNEQSILHLNCEPVSVHLNPQYDWKGDGNNEKAVLILRDLRSTVCGSSIRCANAVRGAPAVGSGDEDGGRWLDLL